jgi:hypothetical protein
VNFFHKHRIMMCTRYIPFQNNAIERRLLQRSPHCTKSSRAPSGPAQPILTQTATSWHVRCGPGAALQRATVPQNIAVCSHPSQNSPLRRASFPIPARSTSRRRWRNADLHHPRRRCRLPLRCLRLPDHLHGPRPRVPAAGNPCLAPKPSALNPCVHNFSLDSYGSAPRCTGGWTYRGRTRFWRARRGRGRRSACCARPWRGAAPLASSCRADAAAAALRASCRLTEASPPVASS